MVSVNLLPVPILYSRFSTQPRTYHVVQALRVISNKRPAPYMYFCCLVHDTDENGWGYRTRKWLRMGKVFETCMIPVHESRRKNNRPNIQYCLPVCIGWPERAKVLGLLFIRNPRINPDRALQGSNLGFGIARLGAVELLTKLQDICVERGNYTAAA